jgi:hypothetical protein
LAGGREKFNLPVAEAGAGTAILSCAKAADCTGKTRYSGTILLPNNGFFVANFSQTASTRS